VSLRLTREVVRENATTYMEQFFKVVDRAKTEVRWQSEWFGSFDLECALDLAGRFTLAQMLAHETFRKRYESGGALTILELMYPMLQGYDSVAINSDVEFGGTDQKFNNLAGRELMQQANVIHAVAAVLFMAIGLGHIYLGTIGLEGAYGSMHEGSVDEAWAKEHHEYWYNDVIRCGER
jgi:tyrosyl-tRNA synthetase